MIATIRRFLARFDIERAPVYFRWNHTKLPDLPSIHPYYMKEMNMDDQTEILQWLTIHNEVFKRNWGEKDFHQNVIGHPYYDTGHTFFVMDGTCPAGIISIGVFRKNRRVGIGHYLAVRNGARDKGLGKFLIVFGYHKVNEIYGINTIESESFLKHKKAMLVRFSLGSKPKPKPDYWNTPSSSPAIAKKMAYYRVLRLYRVWSKTQYNKGR